jgi:hypothetical protein
MRSDWISSCRSEHLCSQAAHVSRMPSMPAVPRTSTGGFAGMAGRPLGRSRSSTVDRTVGSTSSQFDRRTGTLLVIEIKTRLDDLGAMERQVAWYERMAWQAARRLGWRPTWVITVVLALASDEVERVFRAHRDLMSIAFPTRARGIGDVIRGRGVAVAGRGFAMIDPASRRRDWLMRASVDGRRSRLPYRGYVDAARPAAANIARAPADTNEPSEPRPMNVKPSSSSGGRPAAS